MFCSNNEEGLSILAALLIGQFSAHQALAIWQCKVRFLTEKA
jgi:hypothetical protein